MPIYEYQCEVHGSFSQLKSIASRNQQSHCPSCGSVSTRMMSVPSLPIMTRQNRIAWQRNEESAHQPKHKSKHVCQHNCSHKSHSKYVTPGPAALPWMLGH